MKEWIETGKTVEEAIEQACEKHGLDRDKIQWEILDLPRKSFFGLKHNPARVRVTMEEPEPVKPVPPSGERRKAPPPPRREKQPARVEEKQPAARPAKDQAGKEGPGREGASRKERDPGKEQAAVDYLREILRAMNLAPEIKASFQDGIILDLSGGDLGAVIGKRGETLDALQYLTSLAVNRGEGEYLRVTINCGNYREKRKTTLEGLARKVASQVVRSGGSVTLEPMNPFERRVIHAEVSNVPGAKSSSVGAEPNRRVVISAAAARKPAAGERRGGDRGRGGRQPGREGGGGRPPQGDRRPGGRPPRRDKPAPPAPNPDAKKVVDAGDTPLYTRINLDEE